MNGNAYRTICIFRYCVNKPTPKNHFPFAFELENDFDLKVK